MHITNECMSCGQCSEECPNDAIEAKGGGWAQMTINKDKCIECGMCLNADCPADAIKED